MILSDAVKIIRGEGKVAVINRKDLAFFASHKWWLDPKRGIMRHRKAGEMGPKTIYYHREITGFEHGIEVDHINRNPLDNRRENLRPATRKQNIRNTSVRSDNISGYKGVSWVSARGEWLARIVHDGGIISRGPFKCRHEAAKVYNELAMKYHGEFAFINEIKELPCMLSKPVP